MQTIELTKVCKSYDRFVAVNDLSFSIEQGGVFGLLGPNGAGKTSTIRMMIGITGPDSGTINVFGKPFERKSLEKIGYLPEERGLYKKMKILDQLVFLGELHGMTADGAKQQAVEWCKRLEIDAWLQKKVEELSKGMQQKIQFIAALLHDPDFVIMDEPDEHIVYAPHEHVYFAALPGAFERTITCNSLSKTTSSSTCKGPI